MAPCPDRTPGPLTITQGQAQYTTETGYQLQGPVRPKGELDMRLMSVGGGGSRALKMRTAAQIDRTGTVHGRQVAVGGELQYEGGRSSSKPPLSRPQQLSGTLLPPACLVRAHGRIS